MQQVSFGALNWMVLGVYLSAMAGVGVFFARRQESGEMYFLGGRRLPWLAVGMSMYASLTSAVTFLGVPGTAFAENISLAVVALISPLVAPVLIFVFYPVYARMRVTTSYEYIRMRFGPAAHWLVALLFILARLGWLATVIYAPAMALATVSGIPLWLGILAMGLMATFYTVLGGLSAVVWTDVIQFVILIAGLLWVAASLVGHVPGGLPAIWAGARAAGRLHVVDWKISLFAMSAPVVAISFFLQMMQDYGTDQVTVQRLLAAGSYRNMVKAIAFNAITDFFTIGTLLVAGLGLLAYFSMAGQGLPANLSSDQALPFYIVHALPAGISGLVVTAIFAAAMSSLDSGINSITTVILRDFWRSRIPGLSDRREVAWARGLTLLIGLLATGAAFGVIQIGGIIKAFASFMGLFNAPVLALFLLGMLTRRGCFAGWLAGLACAIPGSLWLQYGIKAHWVYFFPASFLVCFTVGWAVSLGLSKCDHLQPLKVKHG